MAQINYNSYVKQEAEKEAQSRQGPKINYFYLKNDKNEALVRIMHDSTDDFDMLAVHPVMIQGKQRNINCLRSPNDPISKCPFCEANKPLRSKMYIHMLQYTKDDQGNIVTTPVLWDRSASYAMDIASKLETYGPLSDSLFKIRRNGAAGSMNTSYSIDYAPPSIYNPDLYKKDTSVINEIKALGTAVLDKDYESMKELLGTSSESEGAPAPKVEPNNTQYYGDKNQSYANSYQQPIHNSEQANNTFNTGNFNQNSEATTEIPRPRRYY